MSRIRLSVIAASVLALASSSALAQHAKYVLFGSKEDTARANVAASDKFVHPLTSPYFAEDSFVTTDLRLWYAYHNFANGGVINGGDAQVAAAQIRVALTDKLQLVAYKDGYVDFDSGLVKSNGYNDLAAGLKYNFIQDWENQLHVAAGLGYEFPIGDTKVFQNDEELRGWVSVNKGFDALHLGATLNYQYALNDGDEAPLGNADQLSWHLHADYYINQYVSPVIEVNGYHVVNRGTESVPFSGVDVANFGGGGDVISAAVGAEIRPVENVGVRAAYELPLTSDDNDLYGWRLTFSVVVSF